MNSIVVTFAILVCICLCSAEESCEFTLQSPEVHKAYRNLIFQAGNNTDLIDYCKQAVGDLEILEKAANCEKDVSPCFKNIVQGFDEAVKKRCNRHYDVLVENVKQCERENDAKAAVSGCLDKYASELSYVLKKIQKEKRLEAHCCLSQLLNECIQVDVKPICGEDYAQLYSGSIGDLFSKFWQNCCSNSNCKDYAKKMSRSRNNAKADLLDGILQIID